MFSQLFSFNCQTTLNSLQIFFICQDLEYFVSEIKFFDNMSICQQEKQVQQIVELSVYLSPYMSENCILNFASTICSLSGFISILNANLPFSNTIRMDMIYEAFPFLQ